MPGSADPEVVLTRAFDTKLEDCSDRTSPVSFHIPFSFKLMPVDPVLFCCELDDGEIGELAPPPQATLTKGTEIKQINRVLNVRFGVLLFINKLI